MPATATAATEVNGYERLAISFWPEYDHKNPDKSVLVIYRGTLPENVQLPARVRFLIPKNSSILAATAIDPGGRLLTQSYDQLPAGDFDELAYNVDFQEFQFEFYYYPIGENTARRYDFNVSLTVPAKTLEFEIQKPLRATNFKVEPASSDVVSRRDQSGNNFEYHNYSFSSSPADREYDFKVTYAKADTNSSVSPQPEIERDGVTGSEPTRVGLLPVFILIGLIVAGGLIVFLVRRRSVMPVSTREGFKTGIYIKRSGAKKAKHCKNCGGKIEPGVKYCPECGTKA